MPNYTFQGELENASRILYTPSAFAKENLVHLQEIGRLTATSPHTSRRSGLGSCLFFLVEGGSGSLVYQGREYPLKTGDCVFINCRSPYAHTTGKDLWQLRWVHFYGPTMDGIHQKYCQRGGLPAFTPSDLGPYTALLEEVRAVAASSDHLKDMKICLALTSLLTLLMEESWQPEGPASPTAKGSDLAPVKEYLEEHFREKITLDQLAAKFYMNKYYLAHMFKQQYGVPVNQYLQQIKITQAKQLLRFSDFSMEKIAAESGLGDANYFSRVFKKVEGVTPGEYRRLW